MNTKQIIAENQYLHWHLTNNIIPTLSQKAITGIIGTINKFKTGDLSIDDPIHDNTDITVGELIEDLKLTN